MVDNVDGVVVDHGVHEGNPPEGPLLEPSIRRVTELVGKAPREVTADRGYGAAQVDSDLSDAGVGFVAIIRKGRQSQARQAVERGRRFRRLIKWRTGSEARISTLKHRYGWNRSLMDGLAGTRTWCGYGVFAHNSIKISGLIATQTAPPTPTRPPPPGTGPPGQPPPTPTLPLLA